MRKKRKKKMAIEFEIAEEVEKTLSVPLSAIQDHYRREGYEVLSVSMGYEIITGETSRNPPEACYQKYPQAYCLRIIGHKQAIWENQLKPTGLNIRLRPIKKEKKDED